VAMPEILNESGEVVNSQNLVYTWKVDGNPAPDVSGYGKNFIFFNGSIPLRPAKIDVTVTSLDKKYSASGSITLTAQAPFTLFYEYNPIYGILYNKILEGNISLQNAEIKIVGIPYFIGVKTRENAGLSYEWRLNNQIINEGGDTSSLSFKQEGGNVGTALVSLQISNPSKMFQFTTNSLSLTFGQKSTLNLFGTQ